MENKYNIQACTCEVVQSWARPKGLDHERAIIASTKHPSRLSTHFSW